ncbi:hypothetical protein EsH8_XIV_000014 [Colletotrichum jinshuiense]
MLQILIHAYFRCRGLCLLPMDDNAQPDTFQRGLRLGDEARKRCWVLPRNIKPIHAFRILIIAALLVASVAVYSYSRAPPPKPVPAPPSNADRKISEAVADTCSLEATLASLIPSYEQPPTFFELLGLDPYSHPFDPPGSSTLPGAANVAAAERLIKEAWLRLAAATDKTYISTDVIENGGAWAEVGVGAATAISFRDLRARVNLGRLSADAEAQRRLLNQVAQRMLDAKARGMYMHYFMPGEQLYKDEVNRNIQGGWVYGRRAKLAKICGWDK